MKLLNAFSLNMLSSSATIEADMISSEDAVKFLKNGFESGVGHADTARLYSNILGMKVNPNRISVNLHSGEEVIIGQYRGPRLPEGATELPEGASITWYHVTITTWNDRGELQ